MRVPHFVFGKDRFERFAGCLAITLKSLPQRAAQAKAIAQPRSCAAVPTLRRAFTHARDRIRQAVEIHVLTTNGHESTRMQKRLPANHANSPEKFWLLIVIPPFASFAGKSALL